VLVSSYISPKAVKGGPSGIAGRGLTAVAPITKDEIVAVKGGHIVDTATLQTLPERLRNSEVQIADGLYLVALTDDEYEPVCCSSTTPASPTWASPATSSSWRCATSTPTRS
jgi:hypothetical protein